MTDTQIIISNGNGITARVDFLLRWCREIIDDSGFAYFVVLMHCAVGYFAPLKETHLLIVSFLKKCYGLATGYSNHVIGPEAVLAAVALGAQAVEVHVTDCKSGRQFRDHALSFEPHELATLVKSARAIRTGLGVFGKALQPSERAIRDAMRKGVVVVRDLAADSVLRAEDLMYARPATQFAGSELVSLVGRRLTLSVKRGHLIPRRAITPPLAQPH